MFTFNPYDWSPPRWDHETCLAMYCLFVNNNSPTKKEAARLLGVSYATFSKYLMLARALAELRKEPVCQ